MGQLKGRLTCTRPQEYRTAPQGLPPPETTLAGAKMTPIKKNKTESYQTHESGPRGAKDRPRRASPEQHADPEGTTPKRSSWARACRIREAPMRELMEAESAVA